MNQPRNYFVFNKTEDFRRGWWENIACTGSGIRLENVSRPGVLWSRLLDSREKETQWHRLTLQSKSLGAVSIRFTFYCTEQREVRWRGETGDLEELLRDPGLSDEDRLELCRPFPSLTVLNPEDILLHQLQGRYLWFRAELNPQAGESPEVGQLLLRFPKETWLRYLPEVYQEGDCSFTERFLGIFQSLYTDLDRDIRHAAANLDPDVVGGDYLNWLSGWLDIEDGFLWPEDKLRELVRRGMELYRIRGTRKYLIEMVKLYTGVTPWVVEHSDVEPFLSDVERTALLQELYGEEAGAVTLVLPDGVLETTEAHRALLRIIENAKPAWIQVDLVVLTPYVFLDQYSYLGINSRLDRYRPLQLDGKSAVSFANLAEGPEGPVSN